MRDVQRNSKTYRRTKSATGKLENILWKKVVKVKPKKMERGH